LSIAPDNTGQYILILKQFKIRKMKFINAFIFAFILLTATTNNALSQTTTGQTTDSLKTATVRVKGITCSMDLKMISANVGKVNGVSSCKAGKQGTTTTFEVKYDPALATEKEIFAAIENTGSCENPEERPYKVKQ
jgi:copper chaperone CopZ